MYGAGRKFVFPAPMKIPHDLSEVVYVDLEVQIVCMCVCVCVCVQCNHIDELVYAYGNTACSRFHPVSQNPASTEFYHGLCSHDEHVQLS